MFFKELILNLPQEQKEKFLRESIREKKLDVFFMLSKIFLDVPISDGGMGTEAVDLIFKEECKNDLQHNQMDLEKSN